MQPTSLRSPTSVHGEPQLAFPNRPLCILKEFNIVTGLLGKAKPQHLIQSH